MVMDLLGPSLQILLEKRNGRFSLRTTIRLAIDLLSILHTLHERSIVHRSFMITFVIFHTPVFMLKLEIYLRVILQWGSLSDKYSALIWAWPPDTEIQGRLSTILFTHTGILA